MQKEVSTIMHKYDHTQGQFSEMILLNMHAFV